MERGSDAVMNSFEYCSTPLLWLWQTQSSHNPLKIVVPVVLDFNPASFVSMMDGYMCSEMFLQAILQIFYCRWQNARPTPGASRPSRGTADSKEASNQPFCATDSGIATQNSLCSQKLFLRCFQRQQHLCVTHGKQILSEPDLHLRMQIQKP